VQFSALKSGRKVEHLKIKEVETELRQRIGQLKMVMGYHPDYHLPLYTRDAVRQVLGGFNGDCLTFPDVAANNLPLKLAAKKEQIASRQVTASYVLILPRPVFTLEGLSNEVDRTSGVNMGIGLDYSLWDGFRGVRGIKKARMNFRLAKIDRRMLSKKIYHEYRTLRDQLDLVGARERLLRDRARLAELGEEKVYLKYKAGDENATWDDYTGSRIRKIEAALNSIESRQGRVRALVDLATLAGGLNRYNARIRY
jgi:outer membrane protein TolC